MAKSQIIKDMANGTASLETTLKRSLVIAHSLKNEKLIQWINNELYGYENTKIVPEYRKLLGTLKISYISGYTKVTNQPIGIGILPEKFKDANILSCKDSIKTIESFSNSTGSLTLSLAELIPFLKINNSLISVFALYLEIPQSAFARITDNVSRQIMNILLDIDDKVGNIDELDIVVSEKQKKSLDKIINVYIDSFINIGNQNEIKNSEISKKVLKE